MHCLQEIHLARNRNKSGAYQPQKSSVHRRADEDEPFTLPPTNTEPFEAYTAKTEMQHNYSNS
jgi:hypothetical protein